MDRIAYLMAIIDAVASCEATQFVIAVEGAIKAGATHEELGKATAIGLRLAEIPKPGAANAPADSRDRAGSQPAAAGPGGAWAPPAS